MIRKRLPRLSAGIAALGLLLNVIVTPFTAMAVSMTISQDGPSIAVDPNFSVGTGEWRLQADVKPLSNTNGSPANASLVFAYQDSQNYYYANYSAASGAGLNGVYKVVGGVRSTVATYTSNVVAGQTYELEVRHKEGDMRVYVGPTFLYKASNVSVAGTKLGVATLSSNAQFDNVIHNLGTTNTTLNLALVGGEPTPDPDPEPVPTPPTVSLSSPANGATVSGTQAVSANASDAQAVTSVQFKLNGSNLGAADTVAPYTTNWDTTTVANGGHTLTAVATNQAGLSTTSTPVNVTVSNQTTPPPTDPPVTPPAGSFTIGESGANAGIDTTKTAADGWRFSARITPTANSASVPANFSLIFNYTDEQNYYYVNYAAASKPGYGVSGIYKVVNGVAQKLVTYNTFIPAGQATNLEVRDSGTTAKIYLNGTYVTKADNVIGGTKFGVATISSSAIFENVKVGSANLSLTPTVVSNTPENPYLCLPAPSTPVRTQSTGRQVNVSTSAQLKAAILDAQPGDTITMADGVYSDSMVSGNYTGSFAIEADGTAANPITLVGSRNAVIDGNGPSGRYGLYLNGASYWNLVGFTVANASKGIVLDRSPHNFLDGVRVANIGAEAVHFRAFSSDNVIMNSVIDGTGKASAQFGEGVYIGSASGANWGVHTGGLPDTSDRNIVLNNTFLDFAAEGIDLKEGSSSNYVAGNYFEGSALSGENSADSWIDVKGRCNLIENNSGDNTLLDAYQVHNVYQSWASYNVFRNNSANVNASGYGFTLDFNSRDLGNLIECNNVVTNAGSGAWNVPCTERYF